MCIRLRSRLETATTTTTATMCIFIFFRVFFSLLSSLPLFAHLNILFLITALWPPVQQKQQKHTLAIYMQRRFHWLRLFLRQISIITKLRFPSGSIQTERPAQVGNLLRLVTRGHTDFSFFFNEWSKEAEAGNEGGLPSVYFCALRNATHRQTLFRYFYFIAFRAASALL